ncbi:MAG: cytochrome c biogenesis protein CcsA [Firmicutes bacterium]|jgi:heme exporter protein C|nr:cytochrome c biogenesis protein CcsA [Bacillota bacterium]
MSEVNVNVVISEHSKRAEKTTKIIGGMALISLVLTVWLGLFVTPPDEFMGNLVRLLYIHPPIAWVMFVAYGVAFLSTLLYLWPRTRDLRFDRLAGASSEVGVVFTGLTLISGSIWGRPTWGAWWTWDPLLTTTALLFVMYLGYLALRRLPGDPETRAKRSAIGGLVAFIDVPIVYFSVLWWKSLHQPPTVLDPVTGKTYIHGSMAYTLLLGFVAFTLLYIYFVAKRYRLDRLKYLYDQVLLDEAIQERKNEASSSANHVAGEDLLVGASSFDDRGSLFSEVNTSDLGGKVLSGGSALGQGEAGI